MQSKLFICKRSMSITSSMPNEKSQTQKTKLIFSDSKHINHSPGQGVFGEID